MEEFFEEVIVESPVVSEVWTETNVLELLQYLSDIRTLLAYIFFLIIFIIAIKVLYTVLCKILFN